jgi:hypothetical protein
VLDLHISPTSLFQYHLHQIFSQKFLHRSSFRGIIIDEVGPGDVKDLVKDVGDIENVCYADKKIVGDAGNE